MMVNDDSINAKLKSNFHDYNVTKISKDEKNCSCHKTTAKMNGCSIQCASRTLGSSQKRPNLNSIRSLYPSRSDNDFKTYDAESRLYISKSIHSNSISNHNSRTTQLTDDVESVLRSGNPTSFATENKSAVKTVCETAETVSKLYTEPGTKIRKETTFSIKSTPGYTKPVAIPGRPIFETALEVHEKTRCEKENMKLKKLSHSTPINDTLKSDSIHFGDLYRQFSLPNGVHNSVTTFNEKLNTICTDECQHNQIFTEAKFHLHATEMNSFAENLETPSLKFMPTLDKETSFVERTNRSYNRSNVRRKGLTRNSRTRRAQRRKRMPRIVIHNKARRNSALLAKNLPYKPKATRYNEDIPDNFYSALITMIFCCLPLGVASMYYTYKVRSYLAISNREMAQQSSLLGRKLANTGKMLGITSLAYVVVYFVVKSNMPLASVEYDYYLPEYAAG